MKGKKYGRGVKQQLKDEERERKKKRRFQRLPRTTVGCVCEILISFGIIILVQEKRKGKEEKGRFLELDLCIWCGGGFGLVEDQRPRE